MPQRIVFVDLRMVKSIENQKKTLFTLHDEIATFKAEYDADKEISPENLACPRVFFTKTSLANGILAHASGILMVCFLKESQNPSCKISPSGSGVGALYCFFFNSPSPQRASSHPPA